MRAQEALGEIPARRATEEARAAAEAETATEETARRDEVNRRDGDDSDGPAAAEQLVEPVMER